MKWLLIVQIFWPGSYTSMAVVTFDTEETCREAGELVQEFATGVKARSWTCEPLQTTSE